jgi:hypothetical protein
MNITRRRFLQILVASSAGISFPAFTKTRDPYVMQGEVVNHIGQNSGFIGGQLVKNVAEWDGTGYPVTVLTNTLPADTETYYDFDLANFNREIPPNFWHDPYNRDHYNNMDDFVRQQRCIYNLKKINHLTLGS